ncbi:MAG: biotin/lipoyl-binding protein, partial [Chloroflexi bacterium]|nr:biotin/lipoyl-binding protein [Chloroflexota bacterium]
KLLNEIGEQFANLTGKYRVLFTAETTRPSVSVLLHQIPGGMLSNLVSQLREQNALDRLNEVLEEVPQVRADLGYPPLVTPTSQVVGIQAVLNVLSGERYKKVTEEVKNYLLGHYGRPPGKVNERVRKTVNGDQPAIDVRPADLIKPELEKLRNDALQLDILHQEEDLMTYALYPQVAVKFLRGELKEEAIPSASHTAPSTPTPDMPLAFSVDVDGEIFNVKIAPLLSGGLKMAELQGGEKLPPGAVVAPMPGMMLSLRVHVGDKVKEGDVVALIEAMKMQNEIQAPHGGVVKKVCVRSGDLVKSGDLLMVIDPNG